MTLSRWWCCGDTYIVFAMPSRFLILKLSTTAMRSLKAIAALQAGEELEVRGIYLVC